MPRVVLPESCRTLLKLLAVVAIALGAFFLFVGGELFDEGEALASGYLASASGLLLYVCACLLPAGSTP
ncbi:MAG: hypothetical protein AAF533_15020 [Acidobacteriota bacterium]